MSISGFSPPLAALHSGQKKKTAFRRSFFGPSIGIRTPGSLRHMCRNCLFNAPPAHDAGALLQASGKKEEPPTRGGSCFFGPSRGIRTPGIVVPNNLKRFFLVIYSAFWCFLVGFRYSLDLFEPAFFRCSGAVCGHLCGQKRFPP